jgi:hypothetical protein
MRAYFDHPEVEAAVERLAELGRVVLFDKRGTGLSDRVKELPTLEVDIRPLLSGVRVPPSAPPRQRRGHRRGERALPGRARPGRRARAGPRDGPRRAIRCAHALVDASVAARAGVHTGEVRPAHGALSGPGVETARAILASAPSGAVWGSRVVRDLLHGSPLRFEPVDATLPLPVLRSLPS